MRALHISPCPGLARLTKLAGQGSCQLAHYLSNSIDKGKRQKRECTASVSMTTTISSHSSSCQATCNCPMTARKCQMFPIFIYGHSQNLELYLLPRVTISFNEVHLVSASNTQWPDLHLLVNCASCKLLVFFRVLFTQQCFLTIMVCSKQFCWCCLKQVTLANSYISLCQRETCGSASADVELQQTLYCTVSYQSCCTKIVVKISGFSPIFMVVKFRERVRNRSGSP